MWILLLPFHIDLPGFYACRWIGSSFVWGFAHSQRLWKIRPWQLGYEDWYSEMSRDGIQHLEIEMWVKFTTGCKFSKFPWAETFLLCIRSSLHLLCCWTHFKIQRCCETTWPLPNIFSCNILITFSSSSMLWQEEVALSKSLQQSEGYLRLGYENGNQDWVGMELSIWNVKCE